MTDDTDYMDRPVMSLGEILRGGQGWQRQTPQVKVRSVECPYCHAGPGQRCIGRHGKPVSNHGARDAAYGKSIRIVIDRCLQAEKP